MVHSVKDRVKEMERQNHTLTGSLVDAVWVVDAETLTYDYVTPSIHRISGYRADELLNTSVTNRISLDMQKKIKALIAVASEEYDRGNREARSLELELVHKTGSAYWIEIRAKLLEESSGELKIVGVTRDITTRKNAELQLESQNMQLVEILAEKEKLLKEIRALKSLLPICSGCKRIRDDGNKWWPLDAYIRAHTNSEFTHTVCPDCKDVFYNES